MVSGSISLLCSRFFSPFLHSTGSLSVSQEYLALRDGPRSFTQDFTCPALLRIPLGKKIGTCTGLSPYTAHLSRCFHLDLFYHFVVLQPRICRNRRGLGCSPFARHYLGNHYLFSSPRGNEMFQFPPFAYHIGILELHSSGLPHSEINGSMAICAYPMLIAAYHVLLRL